MFKHRLGGGKKRCFQERTAFFIVRRTFTKVNFSNSTFTERSRNERKNNPLNQSINIYPRNIALISRMLIF